MSQPCKLAWLILGLTLSPLLAHHGSAASYDQKKVVKVEGTVSEFMWRNPHSSLYLKGSDAVGKPIEYSIEMFSPGQMLKVGLTKTSFKPGDHVILEAHPSFTNPAASECQGCRILINGREIKAGKPEGFEPDPTH